MLRTDLTGRIAVVTGSSRGLGAATARTLAALGADTVVTYKSNDVAANAQAYGSGLTDTRMLIGETCANRFRRLWQSDSRQCPHCVASRLYTW